MIPDEDSSKTNPETITLTLPNEMKFLPLATGLVAEIGKITGFKPDEISKLKLAVDEAGGNVIKHALDTSEKDHYSLVLTPSDIGLKIIVKEKGMPFDPTLFPEFDPASLQKDTSARGLGIFLMKQFMDEVSFHNLGREGKETHLFKYLSNDNIEKLMTPAERQEIEKSKAEEPLPPGSVPCYIRRMKPDEAIEISKSAFSSYGYTYVYETIYYPDRVRDLNRTDELISFFVVSEGAEEIMGHSALVPNSDDPGLAEIAVAFVKPKFRGHGLFHKLMPAQIEEAKRRKFTVMFAECVTTHPYSQKPILKHGFKDTCLLLGMASPEEFKGIEQKKMQRESLILSFLYLTEPGEMICYPPDHHKDMIEKTLKHAGILPVVKNVPEDYTLPSREPVIKVITKDYKCAFIRVDEYGRGIVEEVGRTLSNLCFDKMETVYLYLRLADPGTGRFAASFEKLGFFYAGVVLGSDGYECLVLQYLNNHVIDLSILRIASEMGRDMLAYIEKFAPE
jgi:serine/threonine-protein kinase RsbW